MIHKTKPTMPSHLSKLKKGYVYLGEAGTFVVPEKWRGASGVPPEYQEPYYAYFGFYADEWAYKRGWDSDKLCPNHYIATKIGSNLHRLQPWFKDKDSAKKRAFIKHTKACYKEMFGKELKIEE